MFKWLRKLFPARGLVLRREKVEWTTADAAFWRGVVGSEHWKKVRAINEDSILQEIFLNERNRDIPDLKSFALGRMTTINLLESLQGVEPKPKQDEDEQLDPNAEGFEEDYLNSMLLPSVGGTTFAEWDERID